MIWVKNYLYFKPVYEGKDTNLEIKNLKPDTNYTFKLEINLEDSYEKEEVYGCTASPSPCCRNDGFINNKKYISDDRNKGECKYLYLTSNYITSQGVSNKDKSDRFLTTLILGLFVCLANIGLALFGFLLFRTPGDF